MKNPRLTVIQGFSRSWLADMRWAGSTFRRQANRFFAVETDLGQSVTFNLSCQISSKHALFVTWHNAIIYFFKKRWSSVTCITDSCPHGLSKCDFFLYDLLTQTCLCFGNKRRFPTQSAGTHTLDKFHSAYMFKKKSVSTYNIYIMIPMLQTSQRWV